MNQIVIIGAGGHGRVVAEIALQRYDKVVFLDDDQSKKSVSGSVKDCDKFAESDFFVAIGDNEVRKSISSDLIQKGYNLVSLISQYAVFSPSAKVGIGSVIMNGAVVNAGATIGDGVIINTSCSVDHDCIIGNYSHISVGAHLAGTVTVGENVFVGCGGIVINNVSICKNVLIGAGATVVASITKAGIYVGVPAKEKL